MYSASHSKSWVDLYFCGRGWVKHIAYIFVGLLGDGMVVIGTGTCDWVYTVVMDG